jgi:hypothetical protein
MPNNCEEKPAPAGSREALTRHNWWHKANDFIISNSGMYEMGDNTNLHISEYHVTGDVILVGNQRAPQAGMSCIKQGEAQGLSDDNRRLHLLI